MPLFKNQKRRHENSQIRFGTDGWRGVIADQFTFENVGRVAEATALYWNRHRPRGRDKRVIVGYDRRFLAERFADLVASVFGERGYDVILSKQPLPTPSLSYACRHLNAAGGVMVTASHNPARYCGIKLKTHMGSAADRVLCQGVEETLREVTFEWTHGQMFARGGNVRIENLSSLHESAIRRYVDMGVIRKGKLKVGVDALHGVGAGVFERLLAKTSNEVFSFNAHRDVLFGGRSPEPIAENYEETASALSASPKDLCLVTDGDADRIGGMFGNGFPMTTHQIICLLLHAFASDRGLKGKVIKALTTSSMVDKICADFGFPLVETRVGFKDIGAEMTMGPYLMGVEESGGLGFPNHIPERDGILAGLLLIELLLTKGRSLEVLVRELESRYGPHAYGRIDVSYPLAQRERLMDDCRRHAPANLVGSPVDEMKTFDGVKYVARNGSWLMLRGSGTEPIVRVYAEAETEKKVLTLLRRGQRILAQSLT